jgi:hypothetical protein
LKSKSCGDDSGFTLLVLLKVLNISSFGTMARRSPMRKRRDRPKSKVKKALSLRR